MDKLKSIPILHINTADSWRGGEKQTFFLTSYLCRKGYSSYCICQKDSPLHEKLLKNSLPHFPVRMRAGIDIVAAWKISRISKAINAKILHMHTAHAHSLGFLNSLLLKVPVNIVSRRVDFKIKQNPFSRIKYTYPEKYITVSGAIREILISGGVPASKVAVVHSGIDLKTYKNVKPVYLPAGLRIDNIKKTIKIVNVAALTYQKDHETLIKAMDIVNKVNRQNNNFLLIIAGEGELKNSLMKLRNKLKLQDKVIFAGFREDALSLINFADIFVMSSRYEGLGTSIIDAMSLKKPVIATETGGIPELITGGKNGLLVPRENPQALADAIIRLMQDKNLQKKLSLQAFKDAHNFSIEKTVNKTIEVYRELCRIYLK